MAQKTVNLGAPSLTGKDVSQLVSGAFASAKYPLRVTVKNHLPRDVVFPEIPGLHLRHVAHATDSEKTVTIADYASLQRVASSIGQVAELNNHALAVTISANVPDAPGSEDAAAGDKDGAGGGTGDSGTGGATGDTGTSAKKPSDGLSYEQLKDALTAKGITFQANAKKSDLIALLDAAPEGGAAAAGNQGANE